MLFTSEQVSGGHPDKICDQIADAVLTDCLRHDPESRVAIECLIKDNVIVLAGELTSEHMPDTNVLAHEVLRRIDVPEFESYWIADREGRKFQRLNELYAPTGQVGFLASQRVDGKLILPEAVKTLQMKAA